MSGSPSRTAATAALTFGVSCTGTAGAVAVALVGLRDWPALPMFVSEPHAARARLVAAMAMDATRRAFARDFTSDGTR
jgi:hypothetical protein